MNTIIVFTSSDSNQLTFIYLLLYIDGILIASQSKVEIHKVKTQISWEFEMKDLGEVRKNSSYKTLEGMKKSKLRLMQMQYLEKGVA